MSISLSHVGAKECSKLSAAEQSQEDHVKAFCRAFEFVSATACDGGSILTRIWLDVGHDGQCPRTNRTSPRKVHGIKVESDVRAITGDECQKQVPNTVAVSLTFWSALANRETSARQPIEACRWRMGRNRETMVTGVKLKVGIKEFAFLSFEFICLSNSLCNQLPSRFK